MNTFCFGPNPLVSVVIPVYNCERYLAEAISSVLAQTYRPPEIIVVDDGSTDNSAAVARGFPEVKCCQTEANGGISAARNMGVGFSRGDLLSFWMRTTCGRRKRYTGKSKPSARIPPATLYSVTWNSFAVQNCRQFREMKQFIPQCPVILQVRC